jgi:hypothetical protein
MTVTQAQLATWASDLALSLATIIRCDSHSCFEGKVGGSERDGTV